MYQKQIHYHVSQNRVAIQELSLLSPWYVIETDFCYVVGHPSVASSLHDRKVYHEMGVDPVVEVCLEEEVHSNLPNCHNIYHHYRNGPFCDFSGVYCG